jgi:hypothetical protein
LEEYWVGLLEEYWVGLLEELEEGFLGKKFQKQFLLGSWSQWKRRSGFFYAGRRKECRENEQSYFNS